MNAASIPIAALAAIAVCMVAGSSWAQVPGDYNHDGVLDDSDLDLQAIAIHGGHHPPEFDLTKDGWVNFEDRLAWVADLKHTWIGDANLDLDYNSSDMVQVFAAGTYETGRAANWDSGDWDGNGVFDSSDMVTAFADGGYEDGRRLVGDYNRSRQLDAGDLNLQAIEMVRGKHPAYDLNHDGRVDFGDRQVWVCDLKNTLFGDSNLDGELNSDDLIQAFASGKYETGETAGWQQGDWNGDTLFGSSDMILTFIGGCSGYGGGCGGYEWAERTNPPPVPEPGSWVLLVLGVSCLLTVRRWA